MLLIELQRPAGVQVSELDVVQRCAGDLVVGDGYAYLGWGYRREPGSNGEVPSGGDPVSK